MDCAELDELNDVSRGASSISLDESLASTVKVRVISEADVDLDYNVYSPCNDSNIFCKKI
jgi:hypothetical protein